MPNLQRTPPSQKAEDGGTKMFPWNITIEGKKETIYVNENQQKYLTLPTTTTAQQADLLQRISDDQKKREEMAATAETKPTATDQTENLRTPSPSPTEESLEIIRSRTNKIEETLADQQNQNAEAKEPNVDPEYADVACKNRQHEFEQRTKTHLAAPAKKFIRAVNTLKVQLDQQKFGDEISRQYGDELLNDVHILYAKVEEAREYSEEALNDEERIQHGYYLQNKFEDVCECERIHRHFFEVQEENKRLRYQQQQATQPPQSHTQPPHGVPMYTSTPFHQPPPRAQFVPPQGQYGQQQQESGAQFRQQSGQRQYGQQQEYGHQNQYGQQYGQSQYGQQYGQAQYGHQQQPQNPPPGFNIHQDLSRAPTPSEASVIERYHTRFKLNEELSLVEKFDGSQPRAYMAFRAQWTNFYEKMAKEHRSNLDIFIALLKVLGGSAKDLVQTKYPSNGSYAQAIKKLDSIFYNPTNLLRDMVQNLLQGQKMHDTYESLLQGMTKLMDAWNDLNQADLTKDQLKGLLFIAATEKNLSEESWKCWISEQNDPKYRQNPMACFEISAYMGAMNTAMLNAQKRKNALGGKGNPPNVPPKTKQSGKKQSTLYGAYNATVDQDQKNPPKSRVQKQARGPNDTCVFCRNMPHKYQLQCPQLKNMKPNEIYGVMTNTGIECQMCLSLGHRTRACPALQDNLLKKCKVIEGDRECGLNHCRYLHKSKTQNGETNQTPKPKQE